MQQGLIRLNQPILGNALSLYFLDIKLTNLPRVRVGRGADGFKSVKFTESAPRACGVTYGTTQWCGASTMAGVSGRLTCLGRVQHLRPIANYHDFQAPPSAKNDLSKRAKNPSRFWCDSVSPYQQSSYRRCTRAPVHFYVCRQTLAQSNHIAVRPVLSSYQPATCSTTLW